MAFHTIHAELLLSSDYEESESLLSSDYEESESLLSSDYEESESLLSSDYEESESLLSSDYEESEYNGSLSEVELGGSLNESNDESQESNSICLALPSMQPRPMDVWSLGSPFDSDNSCVLSTNSSTYDELGVSYDDLSDSSVNVESSTTVLSKEVDFETVQAKLPSPRHTNSILSSEVSAGKKLKCKALSIISIRSALNYKCSCGRLCIHKLDLPLLRQLRHKFWINSRTVRMQLLNNYLLYSEQIGKFRFINVDNVTMCSKAFMTALRINKNTYSKALDMCRTDKTAVCPKKPRDISLQTIQLINWVEEYSTYHGDRMPDSADILLPYRTQKSTLYEKYRTEATLPVSRSQFFKTWSRYFPQLKIKKTNSFSKCTTCVTLERQLEKTTCIETRVRYRQLKEEHNNRQMMERKYYYSKRELSRRNPTGYMSLIIDGMDQSKSNLPHFTGRRPKNINAADLLKTHITGVINHGHGGFSTYIDINEYPHDPNLTINILLLTLKKTAEQHGNQLPPVCYIQADNCYRENKNRYVLAFCELLVVEKIFNEVHLSFLYVGHTHEDVDAAFSHISETLRTTDVETMSDMLKLMPDPREIEFVFNVKAWLSPHINTIEKHSEPLHFKFGRQAGSVKVWFKGQNTDPWSILNGTLLKAVPSNEPLLVSPDHSGIDQGRLLRQIDIVQSLFRDKETTQKWRNFYSALNERYADNPSWTLKNLPRQGVAKEPIDDVPPEIRALVQKEIQVPQVRIKRKRSENDVNSTAQKRPSR